MHNKDTFCVLPFMHAVLNPYDAAKYKTSALPCCRYAHSGTERYEDTDPINKSPTWIKLQEQMLNGEKPVECNHCWRDEDHGITSYRMTMLKTFGRVISTEEYKDKKLLFLELMFGNTCNLSCRMCGSTFSSKWKAIDSHLMKQGISGTTGTPNIAFSNWKELDLSHLTYLKIMGGEPFYQKGALELLEHLSSIGVLKNISLTIPTNCTVELTDRWKELLIEAKNAVITISVDGPGLLNDYIREGSSWSQVEENIFKFHDFAYTFSRIKMNLQFNSVVSVYNINQLNDIQNYFKKRFSWPQYFDIAYYPDVLDIALLPDHIKEKIILKGVPEKILSYIKSKEYSEDNFNKLKSFTEALDKYHGKNLKDYNPEMYNWIFHGK